MSINFLEKKNLLTTTVFQLTIDGKFCAEMNMQMEHTFLVLILAHQLKVVTVEQKVLPSFTS